MYSWVHIHECKYTQVLIHSNVHDTHVDMLISKEIAVVQNQSKTLLEARKNNTGFSYTFRDKARQEKHQARMKTIESLQVCLYVHVHGTM